MIVFIYKQKLCESLQRFLGHFLPLKLVGVAERNNNKVANLLRQLQKM